MITSLFIGLLAQLTGEFISAPAIPLKTPVEAVVGELQVGEDIQYAYKTKIVEDTGNVVKRTPNIIIVQKMDGKMEATIYAGAPQFYLDNTGNWYQLEYATTTKTNFEKVMSPSLLESLKTKNVFAASPETYYPSAGDGYVGNVSSSVWDTAHNAATGDWISYTDTNYGCPEAGKDSGIFYIERCFFPFNTADLPDGATITDATFSVYVSTHTGSDKINVLGETQASPTELVYDDYDNVGSTQFSTEATPINGQYNDFTLNAAGIANISLSGYSYFSLRNYPHDILDVEPSDDSYPTIRFSEYTDTTYDPKLVITYTEEPPVEPPATTTPMATSTATTTMTPQELLFIGCVLIFFISYRAWGLMFPFKALPT